MTRKLVAIFLIIILICSFSGCADNTSESITDDSSDNTSLKEEFNLQSDAENEFKVMLEHYDNDISRFENKGVEIISSQEYLRFEIIDGEKFSYYVNLNSLDIYGAYPNSGLALLWSDGKPFEEVETWGEEDSFSYDEIEEDYSSYVPLSVDLFNRTLSAYINQTGETMFENNSQGFLDAYYVRKIDSIRFYYGSNNQTLLGVKDGDICLFGAFASEMTGKTSPMVREVINALNYPELFDVSPKMCKICNSNNTRDFIYWKLDDGYLGFVTTGGDSVSCYGRVAFNIVIFESLDVVNVIG